MAFNIPSSPHFHDPGTVTKVMLRVVYALVPGALLYIWLFGWGVLFNLTLAVTTALVTEALMLWLRRRPALPFLSDGSALLTGLLLGLALPPLAPWWLPLLGTAFAVIFAKHIYGGLGYNPFNPAMVGYVMLLISFPLEMTTWPSPFTTGIESLGLGQVSSIVFNSTAIWDGLTAATPLDTLRTELSLHREADKIIYSSPVFGYLGGKNWEWINLAFLAGGLWLIYKRVISWHVPAAMLGTLALMAAIFYLLNPSVYAPPQFHLLSGGAMMGAFFIATDPVSGSTTPRGKLIFGAGVAIITYVIRAWGGYPDAIAFSVLLMNMAAPTIDYYTRPRVFGHKRGG